MSLFQGYHDDGFERQKEETWLVRKEREPTNELCYIYVSLSMSNIHVSLSLSCLWRMKEIDEVY